MLNLFPKVSHIDVFATILDYLQASNWDRSDGQSLRRYIDNTSYNKMYDEQTAVAELDKDTRLESYDMPNLMIRKNNFKLIISKKEKADVLDMLYDLDLDPNEMNNLLSANSAPVSNVAIGKAEHLKLLLLEWTKRQDGPFRHYSYDSYNHLVDGGAIGEISRRRTWPLVDYWQSDSTLSFGNPVLTADGYRWNEYFYVGRTTEGVLNIRRILVVGEHANYFKVDKRKSKIRRNGYVRVKVSFHSAHRVNLKAIRAFIHIENSVNGMQRITLEGKNFAPTKPERTSRTSPTGIPDTPSQSPTSSASPSESVASTRIPSLSPTAAPSMVPFDSPSASPSYPPILHPSVSPRASPTGRPSESLTEKPTNRPSSSTTAIPSSSPSAAPTLKPSDSPSSRPSNIPSAKPSSAPSSQPSNRPSSAPSESPSISPTDAPSDSPSISPSSEPSLLPSSVPSFIPSSSPSDFPTPAPTCKCS